MKGGKEAKVKDGLEVRRERKGRRWGEKKERIEWRETVGG